MTRRPGSSTTAITLFLLLGGSFFFTIGGLAQEISVKPTPDQITIIRVDAAHPIKSFDPDIALGTSYRYSARTRRGQDLHSDHPQGISLSRLGADHISPEYGIARRRLALEP